MNWQIFDNPDIVQVNYEQKIIMGEKVSNKCEPQAHIRYKLYVVSLYYSNY